MRSELIFSASVRVPNRFLLCRVVSLSAGRLHRTGDSFSKSINDCLTRAEKPTDEGLILGSAALARAKVAS